MSHFACPHCGAAQIDSPRGYVAGCSHYPPEGDLRGKLVAVYFGGGLAAKAFYCGAWYKSERARREGKAVHPVRWDARG